MLMGIVLGGLVFLVGAYILWGFRKIPAQPPHVALITIFGKRQKKLKEEGWRFFHLYPYWYGYIKINVTKVNQDLPKQTVRTPDLAELEIPISVTWTPAWKIKEVVAEHETERKSPEYLIEYLNSGGEAGVRTILEDIIRERLREWSISSEEGPQDFKTAMGAREEAVAVLLKAILGEELERIPSEIPTSVLLKYFPHKDESRFAGQEMQSWQKKWKRIYDGYSDERKIEIERAVERRRREIKMARQGNGWFKKSQLGIILNRLNVGEIKPTEGSRLSKAMELEVAEDRERIGETLELKHVHGRISELKTLGFSNEQALEIIQTERGKVKKDISESKWNISQETRAMIEKIGPEVVAAIFHGKKEGTK